MDTKEVRIFPGISCRERMCKPERELGSWKEIKSNSNNLSDHVRAWNWDPGKYGSEGGGTEQMCMSSALCLNFDLILGTKRQTWGALLDLLVPLPSVAIYKFLFFCFLLLSWLFSIGFLRMGGKSWLEHKFWPVSLITDAGSFFKETC